MTNNPFFVSFWLRMLADLRLHRSGKREFQTDDQTITLLREIAHLEHRSINEVAAELLAGALWQRSTTEERVRLWKNLTAREQQVVALASQGLTTDEIARRLSISRQTVKAQLHSSAKRMGLTSKVQLLQALKDWDFSAWSDIK